MTKEAPLWSLLSLQNKMALLNQINALLDMDQEELENYFATATSAEEVDHPNLPIISQTVEEPEQWLPQEKEYLARLSSSGGWSAAPRL